MKSVAKLRELEIVSFASSCFLSLCNSGKLMERRSKEC